MHFLAGTLDIPMDQPSICKSYSMITVVTTCPHCMMDGFRLPSLPLLSDTRTEKYSWDLFIYCCLLID